MLQRVPLEVNRRVGKGALCAPCPPSATDRVGTARAIKLACHSNDWSARAFAHPCMGTVKRERRSGSKLLVPRAPIEGLITGP